MLSIFLSQGYRLQEKISTQTSYVYGPSFKFGDGASFSFNLTYLFDKSFFLGFLNRRELSEFSLSNIKRGEYCQTTYSYDDQSFYRFFPLISNHSLFWNGTITGTHTLYPVFLSCDTGRMSFSVDMILINPNTHLDLNKYPCIISKAVTGLIGLCLFVIWLFIWITRFSMKNAIHNYLTVTYTLTVIYQILAYMRFKHFDKSDDPSSLTPTSIVFNFLQTTMIYTVIVLVAKGWCLIHNELRLRDHIISILVSALACGTTLISNHIDAGSFDYIILILNFIFITLLVYIIYVSDQETMLTVYAHLYVIAEQDIDPTTTPIYKKLSLFKTLSFGILIYFTFLFIGSLIIDMFSTPFWLAELIQDLFELYLLAFAGYTFRPRKEYSKGYTTIEEGTEELAEFTKEDIQEIEADKTNKLHGTKVWEEGMVLPRQPLVVKKKENKRNDQNDDNLQQPINTGDEKNDNPSDDDVPTTL